MSRFPTHMAYGFQPRAIEAFRLTRCEVALNTIEGYEDYGPEQRAYAYLGRLVIMIVNENWPEDTRSQGRFYLQLCQEEYVSDDLPDLEAKLYEYAVLEGYEAP